jgi:hypothetical protein
LEEEAGSDEGINKLALPNPKPRRDPRYKNEDNYFDFSCSGEGEVTLITHLQSE